MKTTIKILFISILILSYYSCDNDDGNAPNQNVCTFQGLSVFFNGTTTVQIPESDLQTDFFPNNNGAGNPAVEVWDTTSPGDTFIVTNAVTLGAVDANPEIRISGINYTGTVTCQRAGSMVGEELRLDIIVNTLGEGEVCVIIDNVTP